MQDQKIRLHTHMPVLTDTLFLQHMRNKIVNINMLDSNLIFLYLSEFSSPHINLNLSECGIELDNCLLSSKLVIDFDSV